MERWKQAVVSMRIALTFVGGDAEAFPMFGLAIALHDRGHRVVVSAPERYRSTVMKLGFQIVSSGKGFESYLEGWKSGDRSEAFALALSSEVAVQFVAMRDALRETDVVVGSMLQLAAPSIAEQLKLPYFCAITSPAVADPDQYPCLGVPFEKASGIFASHRRAKRRKKWDKLLTSTINREREFSHLEPIQDLYRYLFHSGHLLIAVDPDVDRMADDSDRTVTGFWFYDPPEPMEPELEAYFSTGPLPIYIDLGRANVSREFMKEFCGRLAAAGSRAIVRAVGTELAQMDLPITFRMIESVGDSLLFSRVSAVLHMGKETSTSLEWAELCSLDTMTESSKTIS